MGGTDPSTTGRAFELALTVVLVTCVAVGATLLAIGSHPWKGKLAIPGIVLVVVGVGGLINVVCTDVDGSRL